MSLPRLSWKYVGYKTYLSFTPSLALEALYDLGRTGSYEDGTVRSEGTGSAWSFTGNTFLSSSIREAVWCYPPSPFGTSQTILVAGSAVNQPNAGAMTLSYDNPQTSFMYISMAKGTGSVNWTAATPISGSGVTGFGYWKMLQNTTNFGTVHMWETTETIAVLYASNTGATYGFIAGAIIDPESTEAIDSEIDGRVYGILTSGAAVIAGNFLSSNLAPTFLSFPNTSDGSAHSGVFTVRGSVIVPIRTIGPMLSITAQSLRSRSGKMHRIPITYVTTASPNPFVGRLREVTYSAFGKTTQKLIDGTTVLGYLFGSATTADNEQVFLEHS